MISTVRMVFSGALLVFTTTVFAEDNLHWIAFPSPQFELNGLPSFEENAPDLFRLPKRAQPVVRKPVWNLGTYSSGARIRFQSDCTMMAIRYNNLLGLVHEQYACIRTKWD